MRHKGKEQPDWIRCFCVCQIKKLSSWHRWLTSWRGSRCLRATPTFWLAKRSHPFSLIPKMLRLWIEAPSMPSVSPALDLKRHLYLSLYSSFPFTKHVVMYLSSVCSLPGCTGLEELLGIEPAFLEFQDTLFSRASLTLERSVQSKEVNEKLDTGISLFLTRVCPYFLLKPAHKCIEWLVHRYAAHSKVM